MGQDPDCGCGTNAAGEGEQNTAGSDEGKNLPEVLA